MPVKFVRTNSQAWNAINKNNYKDSIVFIEDQQRIWSNGHYYDDNDSVNITYSELKTLADNSKLVPNKLYKITDYRTTIDSSIGAVSYTTGEKQYIYIRSLSNNTLSKYGESAAYKNSTYLYKTDIIFDFDNKNIIYMKDEFGNEAPYDFKHIKFNNKFTFGTSDEDYTLDGFTNNVYGNKIMKPINKQYNCINFSSKNTYGNTIYPSVTDCSINFEIKESLISKSADGIHVFNPLEFITPIEIESI